MTLPSLDVMGLRLHAGDLDASVEQAAQWLRESSARHYICHVNVHTLVESWRDAALHQALSKASLAAADGMPLVWLARRRGYPQASRVYGPDFMDAMLRRQAMPHERPWRHFLFGGSPDLLARLEAIIARDYPGALIVGSHAPPFRPFTAEDDAAHAAIINATRPDIVWVGLGAPKQEIWMQAQRGRIDAPILAGVGAAFDFLAGAKPWAPRWMQRNGLEWLFRLLTEPRRLAGRYGTTIPPFLLRLLREEWALRRRGQP